MALIGADDYRNTGPADWPLCGRVLAWARSVLLHAAGAQAAHYAGAIAAAERSARVAIVECGTANLPQWLAETKRRNPNAGITIILPSDGGEHPVPPAPEAMQ